MSTINGIFFSGYFSPRRGYRRVMKFCMGFSVTNKIRFGVNKSWGTPPAPWGCFFRVSLKQGLFQDTNSQEHYITSYIYFPASSNSIKTNPTEPKLLQLILTKPLNISPNLSQTHPTFHRLTQPLTDSPDLSQTHSSSHRPT